MSYYESGIEYAREAFQQGKDPHKETKWVNADVRAGFWDEWKRLESESKKQPMKLSDNNNPQQQ